MYTTLFAFLISYLQGIYSGIVFNHNQSMIGPNE